MKTFVISLQIMLKIWHLEKNGPITITTSSCGL